MYIDMFNGWYFFWLLLLGGLTVGLYFLLRKRSEKAKYIAIFIIAMGILLFEIVRRIVNFTREGFDWNDWNSIAYTLIPRPWCAISCWMMMVSVFF